MASQQGVELAPRRKYPTQKLAANSKDRPTHQTPCLLIAIANWRAGMPQSEVRAPRLPTALATTAFLSSISAMY